MRKLKLFLATLTLLVGGVSLANAQTAPKSGAEVAVGDFYIYNIGSGTYLNDGSSYSTHATVDGAGIVINIAGAANEYTLHMANIAEGSYIGNGGWVDCATTRDDYSTFTFEAASKEGYTNVYKIKANKGGSYMYWAGGNSVNDAHYGNEALFGTGDGDAYLWLLIPKATREDISTASETNPIDVTYLVANPDHERFADVKWKGDYSTQCNKQDQTVANFFERWTGQWNSTAGNGTILNDAEAYQTLTNLPAGKYRLTMSGFTSQQSDASLEITGVTMYAGSVSEPLTTEKKVYSVNFTSTGEDVKIGVKITSTNANWVVADNTRLYYLGIDLDILKEAYTNAKKAANEVDQTAIMETAVLTALQTAISTYSNAEETASALQTATDALNTATNNAKASIAAYANAKKVLDAVIEEVKTTNIYDKAYIEATKKAYEDRTLSTADAAAMAVNGDRYLSTYQKVLAGLWTIGEKQATEINSGFYINTWSTEGNTDGSDFKTPFFEYWTNDNNILGATTLSTTLTGLNANSTYSVSIRARVRQTNDKEKIANAITMKVGDGGAVDISAGDKFNDTKFFIGNFSAIGDTDADGKLTVTITVAENSNISWLSFRNVNYSDMSALITEFGELKTEANGLLENAEYASITGTEKTALETASTATPSTFQQYTTAINTMKDAIDTFKGAKASYDPLAKEIAKATALGVDVTPYNATKASECVEKIQTLKVAEYEYVSTTFKEAVDLGTWNASEGTGTMTGQHWDGTNTSKYLEQSGANYNANSWTISYDQDLTLPAGNYVFKVAGRTANTDKVSMGLVVKNGETTLGTVNDFPKGDVGLGINKKGVTSYNAEDAEGFANDGKGRGWEWRYVKFTLDNPATVNVAITASATASKCWVGFCNATVQTDDANIVDLMKALVALNDAKAKANLTKNTANVGTGVFQYNATTNDYLWTAYETAKDNADNFELTSTTVTAQVEALTKALNDAIDDYSAKQQLNAPDADKSYNIIVATADHAKKGNAVIIVPGNTSDNNPTGYAMNANFAINPNLNQAVKFTKVNGNTYNISFETEEGTTYLTYGTNNGSAASWKNSQIQATTNAENKGEFLIAATETDNVFNIYNTITNTTIACQNGGNIYTEAGNADFKLVEATKPSVAINTTETGWGTVMLPFAVAALPTDVKAYTCADAEGSTLTLVPANALKANTPYIIEGAWNETLYGNALGTALTNTEGWLTGVYVETDAPVGSYVLQNLDGVVGFYKVAENKQPKVGANHAYLTVQTAGGETAREAYFLSGEATGIMAIDALTSGNATIFNAAGAQIPALQKGMNIVRKADGKSYKVIVK